MFVPAGGAPDVVVRVVAQSLSQRLGQPVIVENRPGAGGNLALQAVARAPADGYTLLMVGAPHAINVTLYEGLSINVLHDIVPVASIYETGFIMMVANSVPARTISEFIAYAKSNPGKINIASSGTGNLSHLAVELLKALSGIEIVHIPYRGTPASYTALMAGDVQALFDTAASALPIIRDNRARPIGVTTLTRDKWIPDLPPIADTLPGYVVTGWIGVGAPKGTPSEIVERLDRETNAVLADPEVVARFAAMGSEPMPGSSAEFGKFIASEVEKWGKVVRFAGLKFQ
jgi:tripartite-type tricarboxylate transporter receptor subunit TctC